MTYSQTREGLGERGAQRVEKKAFDWVVVECAERVWYVEPVVYRVKVLVEEFVDMHAAMEEILPCVHDEPVKTTHGKAEEAETLLSERLRSTSTDKCRHVRSK